MLKHVGLILLLCGTSTLGWADQFHYNNVIVGDRAMGLGGAYTGIADDASGVYYNPAGLGFALSNDISGSANAFYTRKLVYKNAIGNENFTEESGGNMAPFFGGLQKLDNLAPGLVAAFGIATLDSDLKDQNDVLKNVQVNSATVDNYHRTVMHRSATSLFAAGIAKRFGGSFALGLSVGYLSVSELVQEFQDSQVTNGTKSTQIAQNVRSLLEAGALDVALGAQWAFANSWSLGAVVRMPQNLFQGLKISFENYNMSSTSGTLDSLNRSADQAKFKKPLGDWPMEFRLGLAWFATPRFLTSLDVSHKTASENGDYALLKRLAVTNVHYGMEFYITPSLPVRFGLFTNYDARPEIDKSKAGQVDHVDYYGSSLFFAWAQPNSQVALGTVLQSGKGEAQKLGDTAVQDVVATSATLAFSATHSF